MLYFNYFEFSLRIKSVWQLEYDYYEFFEKAKVKYFYSDNF